MRKNKWIIGIVVVAVVVAVAALVNTKQQKGAFRLPGREVSPRTTGITRYYTLQVANNSSILRVTSSDIDENYISGINCGNDCWQSYAADTAVSLRVRVIDDRFDFDGYTGACTGYTCELTMNSDEIVKVRYRKR